MDLITHSFITNQVRYGIRSIGNGWDVIHGDDILEEGLATINDAKNFCRHDSKRDCYDDEKRMWNDCYFPANRELFR